MEAKARPRPSTQITLNRAEDAMRGVPVRFVQESPTIFAVRIGSDGRNYGHTGDPKWTLNNIMRPYREAANSLLWC